MSYQNSNIVVPWVGLIIRMVLAVAVSAERIQQGIPKEALRQNRLLGILSPFAFHVVKFWNFLCMNLQLGDHDFYLLTKARQLGIRIQPLPHLPPPLFSPCKSLPPG